MQLLMIHKQVLAFLVFGIFNIGLNEFNPWALKGGQFPGFAFPAFYGMFHMLFSASSALIIMHCFQKPEAGVPNVAQLMRYIDGLAVIGLCNALNVVLNNLSLTLVSLFVNQVIKSSSPLPTIVFENLLAGKRFSYAVIISVLCICVGAIMAPYFKIIHESDGEKQTSIYGTLAVIVAMLASSLKPVVAMVMMAGTPDRPKLEPTCVLFYDCSLSFCFMFIYWLCSYERADSIAYLTNNPRDAPYLEGHNATLIGLGIILASSTMAFIFNLATYYYVLLADALGSTIGSIGLKVLLITIGAIQAGVNDPISICGIVVVALSISSYAYFTYRDRMAKEVAAAASSEDHQPIAKSDRAHHHGKEGGVSPTMIASAGSHPSENTPLKPQYKGP